MRAVEDFVCSFFRRDASLAMNTWVEELKKISSGAFGTVYFTDSGLFAIKTSRDARDPLDLEALVGMKYLNPLREVTTCFVYVFGLFSCSPVFTPTSFCNSFSRMTGDYLVMEPVDGNNLSSILDELKVEEFMSIMYQVAWGFKLAYDSCGFNHNDLHSGNVLVRRYETPVTVKVGSNYITTTCLPVVIDFGRARVRDPETGEVFGTTNLKYGFDAEVGFPGFDWATLVAHCHKKTHSSALKKELKEMYSFFVSGDRKSLRLVEEVKKHYDFMPHVTEFSRQLTWDDFLRFLEPRVNLRTYPGGFTLTCGGGRCKTFDQVWSLLDGGEPDSLNEFLIMKDYPSGEGFEALLSRVRRDSETYIRRWIENAFVELVKQEPSGRLEAMSSLDGEVLKARIKLLREWSAFLVKAKMLADSTREFFEVTSIPPPTRIVSIIEITEENYHKFLDVVFEEISSAKRLLIQMKYKQVPPQVKKYERKLYKIYAFNYH